jgi:hypothetical protein
LSERGLRAAVEVAERAGLRFDRAMVFARRHPESVERAAARLARYRERESG